MKNFIIILLVTICAITFTKTGNRIYDFCVKGFHTIDNSVSKTITNIK